MSGELEVEFKSSRFPPYEGEEEEINPGRFGKRVAEYLRDKLPEEGISTGSIWSEDWGWCVPIVGQRVSMWIGCGNYDGEQQSFLCFVVRSTPRVLLWLRGVDLAKEVEHVALALERILARDSEIRDVSWIGRKRGAVEQRDAADGRRR